MRCHPSICRWSLFLGIWRSRSSGARACTRWGAKLLVSRQRRPSFKPCQCVSAPSPRQDTIPMPVIQTSRGASGIGESPDRELEDCRHFLHVGAELGARELHQPENNLGGAYGLVVAANVRLGDGEAGSFMQELG